MSTSLSVCIICKNEAETIGECLESVKWADEIIVVDSGSEDNTIEIAKRYTDNVYIEADWQGFGEQRRRAERYASHDWVFAIDCDEVVTTELKDEILAVLKNIKTEQVLMLNRLTKFCGQYIFHSGWHPDCIARIYNKKVTGYNKNLVHESVDIQKVAKVYLKEKLLHNQDDELFDYINKRNRYAKLGAEKMLSKNKRVSIFKAFTSSFFAFIRHYFLRLGFLDGRAGFIIAVIQSQYTFNKYMFACYLEK